MNTYSVCPSTVIFDSTELKSRHNKPYNFPITTLSCLRVTRYLLLLFNTILHLLLTKPIPSYLNSLSDPLLMIQLYTKRCGSITIIDNNMNIQKNEWLIDVIHTIPWKGNKVTMDFNNTCKTIFLWAGIKTYYSNLKWFLTRIWLVSFDLLVGIIPHNSYCHRKFIIIPNDWDNGT